MGLMLPLMALRDLLHGWRSALCLMLGVAVALVPVLLLGGLGRGYIDQMIGRLAGDPRILELKLARDMEIPPAWFDSLREDPRLGFVLPRSRYLAAAARLTTPEARDIWDVRLLPTAAGDPLLGALTVPEGLSEAVLTGRLAVTSGVAPGGEVTLIVQRRAGERIEAKRLTLTVTGVLPRDLLQSDDLLVSPALENAIERWREGYGVPALDWPGLRDDSAGDARRSYASFRLYATDIRAVPSLRNDLMAQGFDITARSEEIETALAIEEGLGWVFRLISFFAILGFVLTLGLHLAAGVMEKARDYALLRLLGLRPWAVALLPLVQGGLIAGAGAALAGGLVWAAQPVVNARLHTLGGIEGPVMALQPVHILAAVLVAALAGALSGCLAGIRAARIDIADGLRKGRG